MMNSSYPIRFVLVAGMLCALLPGRASSFRGGAEENLAAGSPVAGIATIPAAQAPAIPVAGSSTVAAADSRVAPVSDSAAGSLPDSLSDASYLTADPMPAFGDGGIEEFRRWVQERLVYPDEALGRGIQLRCRTRRHGGRGPDAGVARLPLVRSRHPRGAPFARLDAGDAGG